MNTPTNAVPVLMKKPEGITIDSWHNHLCATGKGDNVEIFVSNGRGFPEIFIMNKQGATELRDFLNKWLAED